MRFISLNKGYLIPKVIAMHKMFFLPLVFLQIVFLNHSIKAQQKPNIIYIYADDLGYGEIEPYGQKKIKTPHLTDLANNGMLFTQHYSSAPVCAPARAMLLTGKHGGNSYIRGNYELGGFADSLEGGQMPLPEGILTLPKLLKQNGYRTAMAGKWGLGMHNTTGSPAKQGFDYYLAILDQKQAHNFYPTHLWENDQYFPLDNPYVYVHKGLNPQTATEEDFNAYVGNQYATDIMTEKALQFVADSKEQPFFLYLPYTQPHVSLQAPQEYIDMYEGAFDEKPYYGEQGYAPSLKPYATYAAMITYLDAQVGKVVAQLKKLGIADNTIVMFSSDNGTTFNGGVDPVFFNSVAGLRGLKTDVYEGGTRVPFIVSWPAKIAKGTVSDLPSVQYDMMATVGDLIGVQIESTDGISLLPTFLGHESLQKKRDYIYWEYPEKGGQIAIRKGSWKAVKVDLIKNGFKNAKWQLYNLDNDPAEKNDLAHKYTSVLQEFDAIVEKEHSPAHIKEWEIIEPKYAR